MALGSNTTLAYSLAAVLQNHDVYIYQFIDEEIPKISDKINVIHLNKNNASELIFQYQNQNLKTKIYPPIFSKTQILLSEIEFVIQRLEPMKTPFPPVGKILIEDFLVKIKNIFPPYFIFNAPFNCFGDKEFPLLFENIATPTATTYYNDQSILKKTLALNKNFVKKKFIFKPDNSAQAFGVFAVEFNKNGYNLSDLQQKTIDELSLTQSYQINEIVDEKQFLQIVNILCFIQFYKTQLSRNNKKIAQIDDDEIICGVKNLYGHKILIQPFLEGVRLGDIRISLAKMANGDFKIVGAIFRKIIKNDAKNFTTGFMSGRTMPEKLDNNLTIDEKNQLKSHLEIILHKLNSDLRQKYQNSTEIGCDFILSGNSKDVYFGEANHHCQALIPLAELVLRDNKEKDFFSEINGLKLPFNGGLAIVSEIIKQQISLQANVKIISGAN